MMRPAGLYPFRRAFLQLHHQGLLCWLILRARPATCSGLPIAPGGRHGLLRPVYPEQAVSSGRGWQCHICEYGCRSSVCLPCVLPLRMFPVRRWQASVYGAWQHRMRPLQKGLHPAGEHGCRCGIRASGPVQGRLHLSLFHISIKNAYHDSVSEGRCCIAAAALYRAATCAVSRHLL